MTNPFVRGIVGLGCIAALGALATAQEAGGKGLPDGPKWGRGPVRPEAANTVFATADGCALCHSAAPFAAALRSPLGDDVSPYGLWQATMMANAFRDPYWRAQVAREGAAAPEKRSEIEALCLRCHAPMASHTARIAGTPSPSIRVADRDGLARDGVSCTVCHQIRPDGLGTEATFAGKLDIRPGRQIFGPFADPVPGPMRAHSAFMPTEGAHIRDAGLCGACHTLETSPGEGHPPFLEQAPYLEWKNSVFTDEGGRTDATKTCQECHMADVGAMRIARNPGGRDFNMAARDGVRGHAFVGGNAFMLGLLRKNAAELGVTAPEEAFRRMEYATRRQLREDTARLSISKATRRNGRLEFAVTVENLTGHKLPTGYPARRAWLRVRVQHGRRPLFTVGDTDDRGRLRGVDDEMALPHVDLVRNASQVPVYEAVPVDTAGKPTSLLHGMAKMGKDTRLLPRGWKKDGPYAARTAPVGVDGDLDFTPGKDTVRFDVKLPRGAPVGLLIVAELLYQPIPPAWVEPLRTVEEEEARRFVRMYDDASPTPETLALATRREGE